MGKACTKRHVEGTSRVCRGYVEGRGASYVEGLDEPTASGRQKGTSRGRGFDVKGVEGTSSFYVKYVKARAQGALRSTGRGAASATRLEASMRTFGDMEDSRDPCLEAMCQRARLSF